MASTLFGTVTVATAGTRVRFATADTPIKRIYIQTDFDNTGATYIGGSDVSSSVMGRRFGTGNLDHITVDYGSGAGDLNHWYVDAATNSDKIHYIAVTP